MSYKDYTLPSYPCVCDVWDTLKEEKRPILVYGMGNGADKLFERFLKYGIKVSDVFASDGFVRGHSYRGYKVISFSEAREKYSDFVIVLSFASNKSDVIEMLSEMDSKYDMYAPDMPVAGMDEYFDREFYNKNYGSIRAAYDCLVDDESRNLYAATVNYKLSGRISYLLNAYSTKDELYSLINEREIKNVIDVGAYNGDTALEAMEYFPALERIYAVEPDVKNYNKLIRRLSSVSEERSIEIYPINAAAYSVCGEGAFSSSANRNSTLSATASYEHRNATVQTVSIDSLSLCGVDYIKYDVEGAEAEVLLGSLDTIRGSRPTLLVSLYHRSRDIFSLVLWLYERFPDHKFYMRRLLCLPAWELDLIMIPSAT